MRDRRDESAKVVPLLRVYYGYEETGLPASSRTALLKLGRFLSTNPGIPVLIEGHFAQFDPDGKPTDEYSLALSERRSSGLRDYLLSLGVASQRIRTTGKGSGHPVIRATNPEERVSVAVRRINSRAEIYALLP